MSNYTDASLIYYPSGVKSGKAYSLKPTDGSGDLTFTRASTATRVNESGLIESVATGVPRIDFTGGGCAKLLLEPQRTNLDTTSQTFSSWTLNNSGGVTTSSITTSNPYNFATVQKVIPSAVLGQHRPLLSTNYSAAGKFWVIAKADGYNYLSLGDGGGLAGSSIIFNLLDGTISGTAGGFIPSITSLGNGWYKCSMNTTFVGLTGRWVIIRNNNTTADYIGDGTSGILFAHKQMEVGAYDTSSILTSGTAVTRVFDGCNDLDITSFSIGNSYTILIGAELNPLENNKIFFTAKTSASTESFTVRNFNGLLRLYNNIDSAYPVAAISSSTNKWVLRIDGTSYNIFAYGSTLAGTFTTARNLAQFNFYGLATELKMQNLIIFPSALTDAECIALTL